ncbi:DUF6527 family protein [Agromyces sp. C10]|uniref:DUF6527 family protein n=1 Tax=Agromyces sp. C10 TaxID=2935077 RepID=UPI0035AF9463
MKLSQMTAQFVDSFPRQLEPGTLYVSARFSTASHSCACGCGREVVTPLSPSQWMLVLDGEVSLRPSIGNWALPCQSHYVIDRGRIRWARAFSSDEIRSNRQSDERARTQSLQSRRPPWWLRFTSRS